MSFDNVSGDGDGCGNSNANCSSGKLDWESLIEVDDMVDNNIVDLAMLAAVLEMFDKQIGQTETRKGYQMEEQENQLGQTRAT